MKILHLINTDDIKNINIENGVVTEIKLKRKYGNKKRKIYTIKDKPILTAED